MPAGSGSSSGSGRSPNMKPINQPPSSTNSGPVDPSKRPALAASRVTTTAAAAPGAPTSNGTCSTTKCSAAEAWQWSEEQQEVVELLSKPDKWTRFLFSRAKATLDRQQLAYIESVVHFWMGNKHVCRVTLKEVSAKFCLQAAQVCGMMYTGHMPTFQQLYHALVSFLEPSSEPGGTSFPLPAVISRGFGSGKYYLIGNIELFLAALLLSSLLLFPTTKPEQIPFERVLQVLSFHATELQLEPSSCPLDFFPVAFAIPLYFQVVPTFLHLTVLWKLYQTLAAKQPISIATLLPEEWWDLVLHGEEKAALNRLARMDFSIILGLQSVLLDSAQPSIECWRPHAFRQLPEAICCGRSGVLLEKSQEARDAFRYILDREPAGTTAVKKRCVPSASKRKRPPQPCPPAATPKPEYTAIHKGWDPGKFKIVGNNGHFWVLVEEGTGEMMFILENRDLLLEGTSKQLEAAGLYCKQHPMPIAFAGPKKNLAFAGTCGHRDLAYCTIGFINLHHASFLDCAQKLAPCMFLGPCLKNAQCMFSKRIICKTEKLFPELALRIICETAMYGPALSQYLEAFPDPGTAIRTKPNKS
ncbi:hypothetical protein Pelo_16687 [Pelomyxa schiedti]|nr:hypothetical protein Pelo_16687 [Pelomyxa schiedti]